MSFNVPELAENDQTTQSDPTDRSLVTVYDLQTKQPLQLPAGEAQQKLLAGEVGLPKGERITLVGPDGQAQTHVAGDLDLHGLVDKGMRLGSDAEHRTALAREAAEVEAAKPYNQGLQGSLRAGAFGAYNALSLGATEALHQGLDTEEQKAIGQKLEEDHAVAHAVGSLAGTVATLPLAGGAGAIGDAVGGRIAGETALSRIAGSAADLATQGAVLSAPKATAELIAQRDPERAAETLLWGIGPGAVLGAGGRLLSEGAEAGASSLSKLVGDNSEEAADLLKERLGAVAHKVVHKTVELGSEALGLSHGPGGWLAAKAMAPKVASFISSKVEENLIPGLANKLRALGEGEEGAVMVRHAVDALDRRLTEVSGQLTKAAAATTATDPVRALLGKEANGLTRDQQLQRLADNLAQAVTDQDTHYQRVGALSNAVTRGGAPDVGGMMATKINNAVSYLYANVPKPPEVPSPFSGPSQWKPTDSQQLAFRQKAQVVVDPMSVFNEIRKGTLTSNHVNALEAVYPSILSDIRATVMAAGNQPKAPALSPAKLQKVSLLLGRPLTPGQQPANVQAMQATFQQQPDQGQKPSPSVRGSKALKDLPSLATSTEKLASGDR